VTYPRLIIDAATPDGYKLQAWPHGLNPDGTKSWCVELTRPGDSKPANVVGRNRPGWPEFHHKDSAWDAAEWVQQQAREHDMLALLPVEPGLRFLHRLAEHMEGLETA